MQSNKIEEMARQERLDYFKQWRAQNPEKVRKHNKTYWAKRAERKLKEEANAKNADY